MTFLADENVDRPIVDRLRKDGYTVTYVAELNPGILDEVVLNLGRKEDALLLTADKDFGELIFRQHQMHGGIVLLRLAGLSPEGKAALVSDTIRRHAESLSGSFSVLSPGAFRIRRPKV